MEPSRQICYTLDEVRQSIAKLNSIPYSFASCPSDSHCCGDCPSCEQKKRYLNQAIKEKQLRGEPISIGTLDLGIVQKALGISQASQTDVLRYSLGQEILEAVRECLSIVKDHPDVGLYILEFEDEKEALCVPNPGREAEALFAWDEYDWKALLDNGQPSLCEISKLALELIPEEDSCDKLIYHDLDDELTFPPKIDPQLLQNINILSMNNNVSLSFKILSRLMVNLNGKNLVFSPMGVGSILELLKYDTKPRSETAEVITGLLDGYCPDSFYDDRYDLVRLEHATGLFYDFSCYQIKNSFKKDLLRTFGSEPIKLSFDLESDDKNRIDTWVKDHTHGTIRKLDINLDDYPLMVVANVLYFNGQWATPFDNNDTYPQTFYNFDGTQSLVEMMKLWSNEIRYQQTQDYQVVELEYKGVEASLVIVLPTQGKGIHQTMIKRDWINVEPEDNYDVWLSLPKFKFDTSLELKEVLSSLGLKDLFDRDDQLSGITDEPVRISRVQQRCTVAVDEEGTEAAATTYAVVVPTGAPPMEKPKYHRMNVDRPFGFAIKNDCGTLLFMGIVNQLEDRSELENMEENL